VKLIVRETSIFYILLQINQHMQRILFLFSFSLLCYFVKGQDATIKAELAQADRLTKEAKYDEALQHVNNALAVYALSVEALEKKTNVMILAGKEKEISSEVDELIKQHVQQPEYYYQRALIYISKQKLQKAIDDLNNAIYYQMPQKYMDKVYLNRGVTYYNIGDFPKAEADFQSALDLNPQNATAYHSWGMLKYEEKNYEEAIKYFNKAIQYEDSNPVIYYNLAMSYLRSDDMENACYYFNKSCALGYKNACKVYLLQCTQ
jgi:tetratricopeptide (TPR) repeat protein